MVPDGLIFARGKPHETIAVYAGLHRFSGPRRVTAISCRDLAGELDLTVTVTRLALIWLHEHGWVLAMRGRGHQPTTYALIDRALAGDNPCGPDP
jgi:hypothetical protein